jgi:hypothetical protein
MACLLLLFADGWLRGDVRFGTCTRGAAATVSFRNIDIIFSFNSGFLQAKDGMPTRHGVICWPSAAASLTCSVIAQHSGGSGNLSIFTIKLVYFIFDLP